MAKTSSWDLVLQQVRSLAVLREHRQVEDADLLSRFVLHYDEAAFEVLLRRHGPMVLRVARRVLRSEPDAEDVFQATFLLLARKAGSIRKRASVASWLHGTAHRLALHARSERTRRQAKEQQAAELRPEPAWSELDGVLDDVLAQLPEKYRTPLVYCYLEGRTQEEVAQLLGAPLGTVRSWLARGREMLRTRLIRRGISLSAAGLSTALLATAAQATPSVLPASLMLSVLKTAPAFAAGTATLTTVSAPVAALLRVGTASLLLTTLKSKAACLLVFILLAAGTGLVAQTGLATKRQQPDAAAASLADRPEEPPAAKGRVDLHGDPLPPGALARLGTVRFRHENSVGQFAVSPDSRTIAAVAHLGKSLILWDAITGKPVRRFSFAEEMICLAFAPDGKSIVVGGRDRVVRLLDLASGKEVRQFLGHKAEEGRLSWINNGVHGVAFTPDGRTLITWGNDKTIRVWEVASGKELHQLGNMDWTIRGLSPDGKLLAISAKGSETILRLWDVAADKEVRQLTHPADVTSVAFSPDGKTLAVAFGANYPQGPGQITVWDLAVGKAVVTLTGHEKAVFALAFAPDGKALASGGYDLTMRLWDLDSGKERHQSPQLRTPVYQLAFNRDGKTLLWRGFENPVQFWDVATWRERPHADAPERDTRSLAYSPNGKLLASTSGSQIWLWDVATGRVLRKLESGTALLLFLSFSADGKSLFSGTDDCTLHVWDPETGKEQRRLPGRGQWSEKFALSPDGRKLATWSFRTDRAVVLWDVGTGAILHRLENPTQDPRVSGDLQSLCFSSDGKILYAGSGTNLGLLRWDVAQGKALPAIGKHDDGLNGITLSPDDRSLAVVTAGGSLYLWELATGQARLILKDLGYATSVAFSPDGRWLALTNADNSRYTRQVNGKEETVWMGLENREQVRLVRVADGKVVRRFTGHAGGIDCVSFSPDGRTLASGGHDTTILIWEVPGQDESVPKEAVALKPDELEALWADLGGDAAKAHGRMATLIATPAQAVRFLGQRLKPVPVVDPERMAPLLKKLDSDQFSDREAATRELKELGDAAEPALRKALKEEIPLESRRRLETLLDALGGADKSGERLRTLRAIEVLERIANQDARDLLKRLAGGAAGAWLTEEAQGTLQRLEQQGKVRP